MIGQPKEAISEATSAGEAMGGTRAGAAMTASTGDGGGSASTTISP
ncbi:hypothetical protein [Nonomuraea sp. NPDC002799]